MKGRRKKGKTASSGKPPTDFTVPREACTFYDTVYGEGPEPEGARYEGRDEGERKAVDAFLGRWCRGGAVLEVGCGHGPYQDRCPNYVGTDISARCARFLRKPFVVASASALPFADESFDAVFTLHTLEHVHAPQGMLEEILRVVAPDGAVFLMPSWYVRPWARYGLGKRVYADLPFRLRALKVFLPLLESFPLRAAWVLPRRALHFVRAMLLGKPAPLFFKWVQANYERFVDSDSDACVSIDPFDVILFYHTRGCRFPTAGTWWKKFTFRTGPLVVVKGEGAPRW
ncbi:MAG: class I SAM-dependent methyltransferase [Bacteroidota bacterium]|nr:class I SAM-dependent methyltransferase [Bacteroidota bacterium]